MILLLTRLYRAWREHQARAGTAAGDGTVAAAPAAAGLIRPRARSRPNVSASTRGAAALVAHQVRYDLRASFRNPRARFFTFFFPVLLLLIFASVFGHGTTVVDGETIKLSRYYVPGILTMAIVTAAYGGLVVSIATARETGVLKRRRATPVPPALLIAGQALSVLVTIMITGTILLVLAKLVYGVGFTPGGLAAIATSTVIGTLAFACIGYAVSGLIGSLDAAQPIVQATTMPLYFISGVWIPTQHLSGALRSLAAVFPIEHLAAALHLASVHGSFSSALSARDLLILLAWAFAGAAFAARRFSWLPGAATA